MAIDRAFGVLSIADKFIVNFDVVVLKFVDLVRNADFDLKPRPIAYLGSGQLRIFVYLLWILTLWCSKLQISYVPRIICHQIKINRVFPAFVYIGYFYGVF